MSEETILPILRKTYGTGGMVDALADHLAMRIASGEPYVYGRGREYMIMRTCWDWFSGGTAANQVAGAIEDALRARGNAASSQTDEIL